MAPLPYQLPCSLCIEDLEQIRLKLLPLLAAKEPVILDLFAVNACDTAGIQFLCSILASARVSGLSIELRNPTREIGKACSAIGLSSAALCQETRSR